MSCAPAGSSSSGTHDRNYQNESRFLEIDEPSRILFDHLSYPYFQTTITLTPAEDGCQLHWVMAFNDAATCASVRSFAGDGLEKNLDRLTAELNAES
ncbi:SRPBCC domain-containing protein [Blastopirellula retiformator]|uniref:SRPBCC domain-containing protein n=1 Tax=Blastopirellula retiformator TaxID=2527970 RepID=UPI0011B4B66A